MSSVRLDLTLVLAPRSVAHITVAGQVLYARRRTLRAAPLYSSRRAQNEGLRSCTGFCLGLQLPALPTGLPSHRTTTHTLSAKPSRSSACFSRCEPTSTDRVALTADRNLSGCCHATRNRSLAPYCPSDEIRPKKMVGRSCA